MSPRPTERPRSRFVAVLLQRCPRCLDGKVFEGIIRTRPACPRCGFVYGREEGYFTGAMYASYIVSLPVVFGIFLLLWAFSSRTLLAAEIMIVVTAVLYAPLVPLIFRYSRVLWLHFDHVFGPDRAARKERLWA